MSSSFKSTTTSAAAAGAAPAKADRVQAFLDAFLAENPSLSEITEMAYKLSERADEIRVEAKRNRLHVVWDTTAADFRRAREMDAAATALREIVLESAQFLFPPEAEVADGGEPELQTVIDFNTFSGVQV